MKRFMQLTAVALVGILALASPALANNDTTQIGNNNVAIQGGNNQVGGTQQTINGGIHATGGNASATGGIGIGIGGEGGKGGNASANSVNILTNKQDQLQLQGQDQHQKQDQNQGQLQGQKQQANNEGINIKTEVPRMAPAAVPAGLSVSSLTCYGSWSIAASTPFGGVGAGFPTKDEDCERSRNAVIFAQVLNMPDVALALLSQNDANLKALKAAGRPVPGVASLPTAPKLTMTPSQVGAPEIAPVSYEAPATTSDLVCKDRELKVRAGNGEYFCRAN